MEKDIDSRPVQYYPGAGNGNPIFQVTMNIIKTPAFIIVSVAKILCLVPLPNLIQEPGGQVFMRLIPAKAYRYPPTTQKEWPGMKFRASVAMRIWAMYSGMGQNQPGYDIVWMV